jgi:hypothetical protein
MADVALISIEPLIPFPGEEVAVNAQLGNRDQKPVSALMPQMIVSGRTVFETP